MIQPAAKCAYEATEGLAVAEGVKQVVGGLRVVAGIVSRFDAIGAMHAHAHLGVVGFFVMLILGVSYRLIPMFTLTEVQSKRRAALSILLLNIGLAGSVVTILLRSDWKPVFAAVAVVGLALFGWELRAMLRAVFGSSMRCRSKFARAASRSTTAPLRAALRTSLRSISAPSRLSCCSM